MTEVKQQTPADPWWSQYPEIISNPERRDIQYLENLMKTPEKTHGVDYAVIDVRGTDRVGGHVRYSFNYRAQDFYTQLDAFGERFKTIPEVFFYCGSSGGRGTRTAGWYQDWLDSHGVSSSRAFILSGGIKAWLASYATDPILTESYESDA